MKSSSQILNTVVFMGSAKSIAPPWGGPSRLGTRVLNWVSSTLKERSATLGSSDIVISHNVTIYDPIDVYGPKGSLFSSGAEMKYPHFYYKSGEAPKKMEVMKESIKNADCYVIVSAEYNHTIPPGLSSMMGHFGGSNYAFKPSAIVTYSMGPWGGMRAAVSLRPFLSELGCIPVSKLCGLPSPHEILDEEGKPIDSSNRMLKQLPAMLEQLEWMAIAMKNQRESVGLPIGGK